MILRFMRRLLVEDQSGATAIEYGILIMLISVAIIASLHTITDQMINTLNISSNSINQAQ